MERLLSACERLKVIYDSQNSYDEFQYEFSLTSAIEDIVEEFNKLENKNIAIVVSKDRCKKSGVVYLESEKGVIYD